MSSAVEIRTLRSGNSQDNHFGNNNLMAIFNSQTQALPIANNRVHPPSFHLTAPGSLCQNLSCLHNLHSGRHPPCWSSDAPGVGFELCEAPLCIIILFLLLKSKGIAVSYTILINDSLPKSIMAHFKPGWKIHNWTQMEQDDPVFKNIEGFLIYGHPKVNGRIMDSMPKLKVISNFGVGVDHIDLNAARERSIPVGNTPNLLDGAAADMVFALLLAIARNVAISDRYTHSPAFTRHDPSILLGSEVHGATLGIIGLGNIGWQVARRASGFDIRVIYHNRRRNLEAEAELGVTYESLEGLLQNADFVSITVPLTDETRGMIGLNELRHMKSTAFLINIARGPVVDHNALTEALERKVIAGAALDVTEPEPLPRDHPLLSMENVIITSHLGSATVQTREAMARRWLGNLVAGLSGQELPSRIA